MFSKIKKKEANTIIEKEKIKEKRSQYVNKERKNQWKKKKNPTRWR